MEELFRNPHLINPNNASQLVQSTNSMEFDHNDSNHIINSNNEIIITEKKRRLAGEEEPHVAASSQTNLNQPCKSNTKNSCS